MTDTPDATEALEALAKVRDSQHRLADKTGHCPPWRHAAFGALFFTLIGSITVSSQVQFMATPLILLGVVLLLRSDRKRYGVFINGYRRGRTLPITLALVGVLLVLVFAAMHMRGHDFSNVSKFGLAMLAFALTVGFSVVWHRVYRRELTGSDA